jgi:1,4-alpha-glucan branching enzyme
MLRVLLIAFSGVVIGCRAPSAAGPIDLAGMLAPDDLGAAAGGDDLARPGRTPGLGATVGVDGTTFQVWAPHAGRVFVSGEWNGWAADVDELTKGAGGVFAGRVAAARAGHGYRYVLHHGAEVVTRHDPRARRVTGFDGASLIVDPDGYAWRSPPYAPPPVEEQVIYELHLGTFHVRAGESWGSFGAAIEKLDHLRDLGVTTIELMPPAETPGERSWGYNPQFPFAVENVYGGVEEMRRFVDEAHARGMGVVVDVVYNHLTSSQQPLKCFDGECLGKNGIYFLRGRRAGDDAVGTAAGLRAGGGAALRDRQRGLLAR